MCVLRKDVGAAASNSFNKTHIWVRYRTVNTSEHCEVAGVVSSAPRLGGNHEPLVGKVEQPLISHSPKHLGDSCFAIPCAFGDACATNLRTIFLKVEDGAKVVCDGRRNLCCHQRA